MDSLLRTVVTECPDAIYLAQCSCNAHHWLHSYHGLFNKQHVTNFQEDNNDTSEQCPSRLNSLIDFVTKTWKKYYDSLIIFWSMMHYYRKNGKTIYDRTVSNYAFLWRMFRNLILLCCYEFDNMCVTNSILKAGVYCSFNNHNCLATASQVTPQGQPACIPGQWIYCIHFHLQVAMSVTCNNG